MVGAIPLKLGSHYLATEAETSVNHENRDGSTSGCSKEAETEGRDRSFFFTSPLLPLWSLRRKLRNVNQY